MAKSVNEKIEDLQAKIRRLEALSEAVKAVESELHCCYMTNRIKTEGWFEEYTDENGEAKTKWHATVYEEDEDGNYIYDEPAPDDYRYDKYIALRNIIEEIKGLA